jgi:DMSO/TMAO reductase YedYZ molybdopterin-dependent catalytic subunit
LKQLPSRTQITRHTCEEGWSAIAQWTGVPLGAILAASGVLDAARFVVSWAYDDYANSIDMFDALHPQTIVAYGMNGRDLTVPHGAPLRLRVERQLGYKGLKFLRRLVVTNEFDDGGMKGDLANGWAWYTGI